MRKLVLMALAAATLAGAGSAQTLDEVLAKNLEARGGKEKINAVASARITGKMTMGQGIEAPFVWEWKRPDKIRSEFTVQGMTAVQAYDGETGWMVMPFLGKTEPEKMPDADVKSIAEQADFEGPLVDYQKKGNAVELLGKEDVEGTPAFKIKLTRPSGDVSYIFLDGEYFLEIKEEGKRTVRGQEIEYETSIGDYKDVDGLMIAHSMTSKAKGMPQGQTITFEKVELNPDISDARFTMPAPEKTEAPAAKDEAKP